MSHQLLICLTFSVQIKLHNLLFCALDYSINLLFRAHFHSQSGDYLLINIFRLLFLQVRVFFLPIHHVYFLFFYLNPPDKLTVALKGQALSHYS